jgi:hypothetical protein
MIFIQLTNCVEQSASWETNRASAGQEIRRMFITAFTTARHLFLSWARPIQSMPSIPLLEDPF